MVELEVTSPSPVNCELYFRKSSVIWVDSYLDTSAYISKHSALNYTKHTTTVSFQEPAQKKINIYDHNHPL